MKIKNHLLTGEGVDFVKSPNHDGRFGENLPDTVIIHYTAGSSRESSVKTLCNPQHKASAHLVIGRDGLVTQLVPFNVIAYHAGPSAYGGRKGFNKYSIGIEIDNAGRLSRTGDGFISWFQKVYPAGEVIEAVHRNEKKPSFWHTYTEKQIDLVEEICQLLIERYSISAILGHEEISPGRKSDPGPAFPLDVLRYRLLEMDRAEDEEKPAAAPAATTTKAFGVVTASKLNIRSGPSLSAETVASPLTGGTFVDILQEKDGWYEVEARIRGWVKKDYVKR